MGQPNPWPVPNPAPTPWPVPPVPPAPIPALHPSPPPPPGPPSDSEEDTTQMPPLPPLPVPVNAPQLLAGQFLTLHNHLSEVVANKIINERYIELSSLAPNNPNENESDLQLIRGPDGTPAFKAAKDRPKVSNIMQYMHLMLIYGCQYLLAHPNRGPEFCQKIQLAGYRSIQNFAHDHQQTPICENFNKGVCFKHNCRYQHICKICKKPGHNALACRSKKGRNQGGNYNQQNNSYSGNNGYGHHNQNWGYY